MELKTLVVLFACAAVEAIASAASVPVVESKGAFVKISIAEVSVTPPLVYFRRDAIITITVQDGGEKPSGLPLRVVITTSAIEGQVSKAYSYRFPDQASALKFCDAVVSEPKG
jgi:hypothetical protein